jgi:hypothetical protein
MSAISGPRAFRFAVAAMLASLVSGCAGYTATPPGQGTATGTATPTPMTSAELAWVTAVTNLHKKIDKPFMAGTINMTRAKMTGLGKTLRACSHELDKIGSPGDRLQPVYVLVKKACLTYGKGARCFAKAASVSDAAGATIAGTPQARTQRRSLSCGFAAQGNGSNLLGEAEAKAAAIKAQFP